MILISLKLCKKQRVLNKMINKKGAVELSISTIVIVVLAMSMLILRLVLIKNIFSGSTENVDQMNGKVKEQIRLLFQDESERVFLYLTDGMAVIKQGSTFGVAFMVRNTERGTASSQTFKYETVLDDDKIRENCKGVTKEIAEKWVKFGSGTLSIMPGEKDGDRIRIEIPEEAPLCVTKYRILIYRPDKGETINNPYEDIRFNIDIRSK